MDGNSVGERAVDFGQFWQLLWPLKHVKPRKSRKIAENHGNHSNWNYDESRRSDAPQASNHVILSPPAPQARKFT